MPHQVRQDKLFHEKHAIMSVATGCLHTGMTECEHVGHEVSKHSEPSVAEQTCLFYDRGD